MKKLYLCAIALAVNLAYAQDTPTEQTATQANAGNTNEAAERAQDYAQPTPPATITTKTTTETTEKVINNITGTTVNKTKSVTVDNSEAGQLSAVESSELILPEPKIINKQMDLASTIKAIQNAFKELKNASDLTAMQTPATTIEGYAGQAEILLQNGDYQSKNGSAEIIQEDLKQLRTGIAELQAILLNKQFEQAKSKLDDIELAENRFFAHF